MLLATQGPQTRNATTKGTPKSLPCNAHNHLLSCTSVQPLSPASNASNCGPSAAVYLPAPHPPLQTTARARRQKEELGMSAALLAPARAGQLGASCRCSSSSGRAAPSTAAPIVAFPRPACKLGVSQSLCVAGTTIPSALSSSTSALLRAADAASRSSSVQCRAAAASANGGQWWECGRPRVCRVGAGGVAAQLWYGCYGCTPPKNLLCAALRCLRCVWRTRSLPACQHTPAVGRSSVLLHAYVHLASSRCTLPTHTRCTLHAAWCTSHDGTCLPPMQHPASGARAPSPCYTYA